MAYSLTQAMQNQAESAENQFFTNLLQYAMNASPDFDVSGKRPVMINPGQKLPPKSILWNQYVNLKRGRIAPEDLMRFEEVYKQVKQTISQQNIKKINELGLRGYSDAKIQKLMSDNPVMYQNLLDMINDYKSMGTEEGMAAASSLETYLPQKSVVENISDEFDDAPITTLAKGVGATAALGAGAYGLKRGWDRFGRGWADKGKQWAVGPDINPKVQRMIDKGAVNQNAKGKWQRFVPRDNKWVELPENVQAQINRHQEAINNPSRARRTQAFFKRPGVRAVTRPVGKAFTAGFAGSGAEIASGLLGASPETSSRIGSGVTGAVSGGMALKGLRALAAAPPVGPVGMGLKVIGNVGLAAYSLSNLWDSFMGDE
jgi:hypothetical protein